MQNESARRGATLVAIVLTLPVLFILSAMAVNLAYIQVIRTKVQITTDASARAAGRIYSESGDKAAALAAARDISSLNPITSVNALKTVVVSINAGDLEFGLSERKAENNAYQFKTAEDGNSVRITTQSFSQGAGDALKPFFPMFGADFDIRPVCTATNTQTTLDVAIIVDRSGSMAFAANEASGAGTPAAADAGWNYGDSVPRNSRWLDLVAAVKGFTDEMERTAKKEKIALVSYASDARQDVKLTHTYSKIHDSNFAISSEFHGGSTSVGDGILHGIKSVTEAGFCRPWATNAVVLMSDGIHNTGTDPIAAAQEASKVGVPVYTVTFSQEADRDLMKTIADMTGGNHHHANNASELLEAFKEIARNLPSMLTE